MSPASRGRRAAFHTLFPVSRSLRLALAPVFCAAFAVSLAAADSAFAQRGGHSGGHGGGAHMPRQTFQPQGVGTLRQTFKPTVYPSSSYLGKPAGRPGRPLRPGGHRPRKIIADTSAPLIPYYVPVEAPYDGAARDLVVYGRGDYRMVRRHRCVAPKIIQVGPIDRQYGPGPRLVYGSRNRCGSPRVENWYKKSQAGKARTARRGKGKAAVLPVVRHGSRLRSKQSAHLRLGKAHRQQRLGMRKHRR